jgi:hypothetical protein
MATAGVLDALPEVVFQAPLIVNIVPEEEALGAPILKPISLTVRDEQTYVDLAQLAVRVGYALVRSDGDQLFDLLPNTRRVSLLGDPETDGLIDVIDAGVLIAKNSSNPQKTVYATTIDTGLGFKSVMATALVQRDVETVGPLNSSIYPGLNMPPGFSPGIGGSLSEEDEPFTGTVLGIEHGPRRRAAYLWLQQTTLGDRIVRLTSYIREDNLADVNDFVEVDWSGAKRLIMLWNEAEGYLEVYVGTGAATDRIFRVPITDFPVLPDDYNRLSGAGDVVVVYGQEGAEDGRSIWKNIAVTTDVGYPVLGSIRMGDFVTQIVGPELWRVSGAADPRTLSIGQWFDAPDDLIADRDDTADGRVSVNHFRMTKPTLGETFALYRREPGLAASDTDGFSIQARIEGLGLTKEGSCSGMGFTIFDGQTVFQLVLFEDDAEVKRVGLLRNGGDDGDVNDYYTAEFDWSEGTFRLVVDPREDFIRIFDAEDLETALLDLPFDRSTLPNAASKGWAGEIPFITFGHTIPTQTSGVFVLRDLICNHLFQGWAAETNSPAAADPTFTLATTGSPVVATANGVTTLACDPGERAKYSRAAYFSSLRGAVVEAKGRVTSFRARHRSGTYLLLDDGVRSFALSFVDSFTGKYIALALRDGTGSFREVVGRDGDGLLYSSPCDWTEFHTYRLERQIYGGFKVYVDQETTPRLSFPESDLALLPNPQYSGVPTVAFGQFTTEGSTSEWTYLNTFFSRGYEISTKKNKSDAVLRNELYGAQAIVVATASDG